MPFCTNCGQEVPEAAKFCRNCGTATGADSPPYQEKRRVVFAGEIRKCPSCGAALPSMIAVCPSCGQELRTEHIHSALTEFVNSLIECDQQIAVEMRQEKLRQQSIAVESKKSSGWATWSMGGKIAWIFLNIYTFCIPLVIYLRMREKAQDVSGSLKVKTLPAARRKASIIENFQIPNDREAMIGTLYLIQGKVNCLSAQATNDKWYWMKLWRAKAQEIYDRASIILPGDKTLEELYQAICDKAFI